MATLNQIATGTLRLAKDCPSPQPVSVSVLTEAALRIHQRAIDAKRARLVKDDTRGDYRRSVHPRNSAGSLQSDCQCARCHTGRRYRASPCEEERRQGAHRGRRQWPWHIKRECRAALQPFFTTKGERGTGLGLCVSKRIIDHHNGTIRVRSSVRPGRSGTAFQISLPAQSSSRHP